MESTEPMTSQQLSQQTALTGATTTTTTEDHNTGHRENHRPVTSSSRGGRGGRSERGNHRGHRDQYRGGGGGGDRHHESDSNGNERERNHTAASNNNQEREHREHRDRDRDRDRPRGDRNRGRGGRGGLYQGSTSRGRGRGHPADAPPPKSNTLVIKDADNEFLRMLKQANEPSKSSKVDDDVDPMAEGQTRKHSGFSKARQYESLQASRAPKPKVEPDKAHKACPVCLMDAPSLTGELVQAVTSCEHIYCFECALRLIFITDKADCPICRQTLTKVVLTRAETIEESAELKAFLATSADPAIAQNTTSKQFKSFAKIVYYDSTEGSGIFDLIKRLLWFNCPFCPAHNEYSYHMTTKNETSFEAISRHLGRKHDRNLCDLCFFNLELFPYEYEFYSNYEMYQHKRLGSTVSDAQVQHRMCHLCPEPGYYFNNEALATHCKEAHISCYVCNSQTIFFIDQPSLVEHVLEQHICCPECQRLNGQVIGFLSVIELKSHAHVEHPDAKIDYESLARRAIANATASATFGHFDVNDETNGDSNMSRREAFDVIDNLLRNRFSAERHKSAPSFNPKTENYLMNFPQIEGLGGGSANVSSKEAGGGKSKGNAATSTNVNLFPGSKYRMVSGKMGTHDYEEEFPGLGPGTSGMALKKSSKPTASLAATAATMKHKPQNWQTPAQAASASQFLKTPTDISNKKPAEISKKLKPRKISQTENEEAPPSIYDDLVYVNPLEAPQTVGNTKPSSIQLIEARPTAAPSAAPKQSRPKGPPPIEAFPALGRPAPASTPGGVNWSKAMASKPVPKPLPLKSNSTRAVPPKAPEIDLADGGSFPELATATGRPDWLGPPSGKWTGPGGAPAGRNVRKKKGKAPPEDAEWYRPNGETSSNGADAMDTTSPDPYLPHLATTDRNNQLRGKIRQQLIARSGSHEATEAFNAFKELSLSYRNGTATVDVFFELGRNLLGADFFDSVICDLISLLPNITKQNELYERVQADDRLKRARHTVLWQCGECSQLVIPAEKAEHQRYHSKSSRR